MQRVLSRHAELVDAQQAATASGSKPQSVEVVVPVLLPPRSRLVEVAADFEARVAGSGTYHGHAIGHLVLSPEAAQKWSQGARIELITEPLLDEPARRRRSTPAETLELRRLIQSTVVNPQAIGSYNDTGLQLKTTATSAFAPTLHPSLDGSAVEMLIVTREALREVFETYAHERTRFGTPTVVRTVEWIAENHQQGADIQETLRSFIRDAYELWGIRYVLIGGDSRVIPVRFATSTYSQENPLVPTDLYYACLDGSWNADGDAAWAEGYDAVSGETDMADLYPEVFVGRIPVTSALEVSQYLAKLQSYVDPQWDDFEGRMLFMGEVIWPANYSPQSTIYKNGADNAERIIAFNGLEQSGVQLTRLYETPELYTDAEALTRQRALQEMDTGYGLVTHVGHGFRYTMSLGDASLTNVQANLLNNSQRPFFLNMLNCTATAFDFPCLAERFLLNANGGAVGVIGASREASPDNVQLYQESWFSTLFRDPHVSAAQALHEARLRYLGYTYTDGPTNGAFRWTNFILSYLGDPKIDVWRGPALPITVGHASQLILGQQQTAISVSSTSGPVAGATVCLWKEGDFYAVAQTDLSGQAFFDVRPETVGDVALSVCGVGVQPHTATIPVAGVAGASLHATGAIQVQDSGPGTIGNGNGQLEAGETVYLQIELRNAGTSAAFFASLYAQTSDPFLVIPTANVDVGTVGPGQTVWSPPVEVRLSSAALDQHRVIVSLVLQAQGWSWNDELQLDLLQVAPQIVSLEPGFAGEFPAAGEIYELRVHVKNYGFGQFDGATASLFTADPDVNILQGSAVLGDVPHLQTATASFRLREWNTVEENELFVILLDARGRAWSFPIETRRPQPPGDLIADPSQGHSVVLLQWSASESPDVAGYRVYRASRTSGPWEAVSTDWVTSTTSYRDDGLEGSTHYVYRVTAIDESGNESVPSDFVTTTTNPVQNVGWPQAMAQWSNSPPLAVDLDGDFIPEVLSGADRLYAWSADGNELRDGDANPATKGVWTTAGYSYVAGLAAADLDQDGLNEVVACSWDTREVYVFNGDGTVVPGWPRSMAVDTHGIWATPAIEDVDLDGSLEVVMLGLDGRLYIWHADGSELIDGDNDPSTQGVFYQIPSGGAWSRGAPVVANLLTEDATPEIVFGARNGSLYLLRADGSTPPGWPRNLGGEVNAAPSVGDIDGDGSLDIAVSCSDGLLHVVRADGSDLDGWPVAFESRWIALTPAVALHDFDSDGTLELVVGGSSGGTYEGELAVFDASGNLLPGWPIDLKSASEASPLIGDIDGDSVPEIIFGGETGLLHGYHVDGTVAPGFPIQLGAEVRATPMLTDVDRDGDVDLLFSGWDQQVYVFDFPGGYVRSRIPWGSFKNNSRRNGVYEWRLPTDVGDTPDQQAVPAATRLLPNVPNPFNPHTTISFEIAGSAHQSVQLFIYDAGGRLVRRLVQESLAPGFHQRVWNGRDDAGRRLASGVYFYRLQTPDSRSSRKMILLR
jgi:hypothetical protein